MYLHLVHIRMYIRRTYHLPFLPTSTIFSTTYWLTLLVPSIYLTDLLDKCYYYNHNYDYYYYYYDYCYYYYYYTCTHYHE